MDDPIVPIVSPDDTVFDPEDMDPDASPATDFWRWANGGWLDRNPVPPEYPMWGAFLELHTRNEEIVHTLLKQAADAGAAVGTVDQKIGDFYASGMDTDAIEATGIEPIQPWLDLIEGIDTVDDLRTAFTELNRIGASVGWNWHVEPDRSDSTQNLLYIAQGGLGLPDRDYYFRDDDRSQALASAYRDHATAMFELLGWPSEEASTAAETIWKIESRLAEASNTAVQQRDVQDTTNKLTTAEVADLTPTVMLNDWLEAIGAGQEAAVNIDNLRFFSELDTMFNEVPIDDWKTYCTWHLLVSTASGLPSRFEDEAFSFWGVKVSGQKEQKPRWKRVVSAAGGSIGHLVAQLYVREHFPPSAKERVEDLVERILVEMRKSIETVDWMGPDTKKQALEKLEGFGYKIGYPDKWRDYSSLSISRDAWLANRLAARVFEFERNINTLGKPIDEHEWLMPPHIVNAYYWPERNEIVFPAGILQPPFFVAEADDAVNLGGIGAVIGHEITHGFDDKGSLFDATGHLRNWWTDDDRAEFEARAKVIAEQFSAYEIEDGLNINGDLTLGENIADLAGLTLAFGALRQILDENGADLIGGLTPEQRFFLSYARIWRMNATPEYTRLIVNSDPHSPAEFRVRGPLSNMTEFADAFNLPDDSPTMRPVDERAKVW
ncbi:MAG: M13 family metallopeptidase [Acidimicrobiia bacterium]|nr:M13 family metallopeptidase [Acidimicrobiia bacterium]